MRTSSSPWIAVAVLACLSLAAVAGIAGTDPAGPVAAAPGTVSAPAADNAEVAPSEVRELRLMTFNICETLRERNDDYDAWVRKVAGYIVDQRLDVVAIQEVAASERTRADVIDRLIDELETRGWPMESRLAMGWAGNALLSRHPIRAYEGREFYPDWAPYRIWIQNAEIELPGGDRIRVLNHHPHPVCGCTRDPKCPYYWEGFRPYVDAINPADDLFVLGDFNFGRASECYSDLTALLRDACTESPEDSCTVTADPRIHPGVPGPVGVDYVFFRSRKWEVDRVRGCHEITFSDHYPVLAVFRRVGGGEERGSHGGARGKSTKKRGKRARAEPKEFRTRCKDLAEADGPGDPAPFRSGRVTDATMES